MKLLRNIGIAITVGFIVTAATATLSMIFIMFAEGSVLGRRLTFFDGLFFEVRDGANGAIQMGFGVHDFTPIVLFFMIASVLVFAFLVALNFLRGHRAKLIDERAS
jgi:hypothetical protein